MAYFVKIGQKAAVALVLASVVIAWAVIAPGSFQATINGALEFVGEQLQNIGQALG